MKKATIAFVFAALSVGTMACNKSAPDTANPDTAKPETPATPETPAGDAAAPETPAGDAETPAADAPAAAPAP